MPYRDVCALARIFSFDRRAFCSIQCFGSPLNACCAIRIQVFLTLGIYASSASADQTSFSVEAQTAPFLFLSLVSCFGVRFFPWHMKDDYRGAARAVSAMLADHQVAWWCASKEGL